MFGLVEMIRSWFRPVVQHNHMEGSSTRKSRALSAYADNLITSKELCEVLESITSCVIGHPKNLLCYALFWQGAQYGRFSSTTPNYTNGPSRRKDFVLSGVTLPPGNKCREEDCENNAATSLWVRNSQYDVCGWHLKKFLEG